MTGLFAIETMPVETEVRWIRTSPQCALIPCEPHFTPLRENAVCLTWDSQSLRPMENAWPMNSPSA